MPKGINNNDERGEVKKIPVLKTTYDILSKEADSRGVTIEEYLEELIGRRFGFDPVLSSLIQNLDGTFWDRRLKRKEWILEAIFLGKLFSQFGQAYIHPVVTSSKEIINAYTEGARAGLALGGRREGAEEAKAKVAEKVANVMGIMLDNMTRVMGMIPIGGTVQVPTKPIKDFVEEERKETMPVPRTEVPEASIEEFEEELDKEGKEEVE